jgi:predicted metal-dependent hydrolase
MTLEPREYRTAIATLVHARTDLLEIRYDAGCTMTIATITEVQEMRRRVMDQARYGTITLIPEDVDFQMNTMKVDHAAADRSQAQILATAVVARTNMLEMLVKLYFSYYPTMHRILVTDNEAEARAWLNTQLEEIARTGS